MDSNRRVRRGDDCRAGFSLVELLVVVGVIGTLVSLTLPAVQRSRESARRASCATNLRQMGIALTAYEAARGRFPAGNDALSGREHAWSSFILAFLDEEPLARRINYSLPWNDPRGNAEAADVIVPTYVCPSGIERFPGKQDYGGILGTAVTRVEGEPPPAGFDHGGILYATGESCPRGCRVAEVTDGLSQTLLVSEGVDRGFADVGGRSRIGNARWACGTNCFLHNSPVLNTPDVDGFRSYHLGGVNGLFGDGRVAFLSEAVGPEIMIALCTKAGGERPSELP